MATDQTENKQKAKPGRPRKKGGRLINAQTLLHKEEFERLSLIAENRDQSLSALLRDVVKDFLEKPRRGSGKRQSG